MRCSCCEDKSCVAAVGLAIEDADFHKGAPYACLAAGRAAGMTDDQATRAALEAIDEALNAGPVAELAPGESRTVDGPSFWRHVLARMGINPAVGPLTRATMRARGAAALMKARTIRAACASEGA